MVVVVGAWVILSLALAGAGMPRRFICPGIGSTGGWSSAIEGLDSWLVVAFSPGNPDIEFEAVLSDFVLLRLRPRDVTIDLRDEVTLGAFPPFVPNSPACEFELPPRLLLSVSSSTSGMSSMTTSHCSLGRMDLPSVSVEP